MNEYKLNTPPSDQSPEFFGGTDQFDDVSILDKVKRREMNCRTHYDEIWTTSEVAKRYWEGNTLDEMDLDEGETAVDDNRIFLSIETIIPIATRRTPEPIVTIRPRNQKNRQLKEKLENFLFHDMWEDEWDLQYQLRQGLRILFSQSFVAFKYFYDPLSGEIDFRLMPRGTLSFPKSARTPEDSPFFIEYVTETFGQIISKFPEKEEALRQELGDRGDLTEDTEITYIEYWENNFCAWTYRNLVLGTYKNPNWNYSDPTFNHFKKPQKPYLILNYLNWGESIADPKSLISFVQKLQDSINKRKRQIELNADLANGKLIASGDVMNKEDFDKITNSPKEKIFIPKGNPNDAIKFFTGRAFDPGIMNDMTHSENTIDNMLGTHSTTRGERSGQETAKGREILKDSDTGRLDLLQRNIERFAQQVYNAAIQMMYVYYNEAHPIHFLDDSNMGQRAATEKDKENYLINSEFRDLTIRCRVEPGSTTMKDKSVERAELVDLYQMKAISTKDLLEGLEYPNADQMARNAVLEQLAPELVYPLAMGDEAFDIDAIDALRSVIEQGVDISTQEPMIDDPEVLGNYIKTLTDYMKGIDVNEDLMPWDELGTETQKVIKEHIKLQNAKLKEILALLPPPINPDSAAIDPLAQQIPPEVAQPAPLQQAPI